MSTRRTEGSRGNTRCPAARKASLPERVSLAHCAAVHSRTVRTPSEEATAREVFQRMAGKCFIGSSLKTEPRIEPEIAVVPRRRSPRTPGEADAHLQEGRSRSHGSQTVSVSLAGPLMAPLARSSRRPMIEVTGVYKAFGDQPVLRGVELTVEEGTTCSLLGGSGSGKTVLLKLIVGLLAPDRGSVRIDGEEVSELSSDGLERTRGKLGILFQGSALFDSLTVFENVAFPLREHIHLPAAQVREKVQRTLALVGLAEMGAQYPAELSGGMCKRVAFARAIVQEPKILLCDDPTAGLDPITSEYVTDALQLAHQRLGMTLLLITHDLPAAFRLGDQLALLHEGQIVERGPPAAFRRSRHPAVRAFLHDWLSRQANNPQPAFT